MLTENTCLAVVEALYGETGAINDQPVSHSLPSAELYRRLLARFSLARLDDAVRWLELGNYIGRAGFGLPVPGMPYLLHLLPRGLAFAESRSLETGERQLLYREEPYQVFVARQFSDVDNLVWQLVSAALLQAGFSPVDGQVDGLDAFRGEIVRKIDRARFFLCLLTHREALVSGGFASSVWLYQETGAAIALGKKPLLLVEAGMHDHYAGELQRTYEYIGFERASLVEALPQIVRRLQADLAASDIPLPAHR